MGAWKDFSISKVWFRSYDYELCGFYDRDIKYLGKIKICITISQEFKIKVECMCEAVPQVNKDYDNIKTLEEAESIINQYFEKITSLRKQLSRHLRTAAENAYNRVISSGYIEVLKNGDFEI